MNTIINYHKMKRILLRIIKFIFRKRIFNNSFSAIKPNKSTMTMNSDIKGIIKVQYLISVYPGKTAMRKTHQFKEEYDAILDMTLGNELPFDKTHPLYFDKGFRKILLEYYKQKENYEKCAKISRLISN